MSDDARHRVHELSEQAVAAARTGRFDEARSLADLAKALLASLQDETKTTRVVDGMTKAQLKDANRRRRDTRAAKAAAASFKAEMPSAPLLAAFALDKRFGGLRGYAKARKIDRSSLSAYARGDTACPAWVDALVRKDFPDLEWTWPKGVV